MRHTPRLLKSRDYIYDSKVLQADLADMACQENTETERDPRSQLVHHKMHKNSLIDYHHNMSCFGSSPWNLKYLESTMQVYN